MPPLIPANASPPARMGRATKAVVIGLSLFTLFVIVFFGVRLYQFAQYARKPHAPTATSEFYAATGKIGPLGQKASGSSAEAETLADEMAGAMTTVRQLGFSKTPQKSLLDQNDPFKVYCDLRPGQCVFLVHVPELRKFASDAHKSLGSYAWQTAQDILREHGATNQPMRLAVALRGNIMFDRVLFGRLSQDTKSTNQDGPRVTEGFDCEKPLVEWFVPLSTNSIPMLESDTPSPASR